MKIVRNEQIMTVRQTSPTLSEGEIYMADELDLDANSVFRPTLQAVLWLSELIATTTLRCYVVACVARCYNQKVLGQKPRKNLPEFGQLLLV